MASADVGPRQELELTRRIDELLVQSRHRSGVSPAGGEAASTGIGGPTVSVAIDDEEVARVVGEQRIRPSDKVARRRVGASAISARRARICIARVGSSDSAIFCHSDGRGPARLQPFSETAVTESPRAALRLPGGGVSRATDRQIVRGEMQCSCCHSATTPPAVGARTAGANRRSPHPW